MIADILPKLEKVKAGKAQGQWLACCPAQAHQDRNPSLSIRELQDGRVLLHCWSGCDTRDIVGAIGLDLRCLYPPIEAEPINDQAMPNWREKQFRDFLNFERLVMAIFEADVKANQFKVNDLDRYFLAYERMRKVQGVLNG